MINKPKPKHPGLMVKSLCIEPLGLSVTTAAAVKSLLLNTLKIIKRADED